MSERVSDLSSDAPKSSFGPTMGDSAESLGSTRPMTFGEKLVGISFNPAGDDKVARAKRLCAELADLMNDEFRANETTPLKTTLYNHTVGEILNAQMNVVKLLTLKY